MKKRLIIGIILLSIMLTSCKDNKVIEEQIQRVENKEVEMSTKYEDYKQDIYVLKDSICNMLVYGYIDEYIQPHLIEGVENFGLLVNVYNLPIDYYKCCEDYYYEYVTSKGEEYKGYDAEKFKLYIQTEEITNYKTHLEIGESQGVEYETDVGYRIASQTTEREFFPFVDYYVVEDDIYLNQEGNEEYSYIIKIKGIGGTLKAVLRIKQDKIVDMMLKYNI